MSESTSVCDGDGPRTSNCIVGSSPASWGSGVAFFMSSGGICPRAVVGSSSPEKLRLGLRVVAAGMSPEEESAFRPTPSVTRFTSRASRASARLPAARFTGMSAASSSSASAGRPAPLLRLLAAASAGVCDPLASSSFASAARMEASASPALPSRFGFTRATVPSSPT